MVPLTPVLLLSSPAAPTARVVPFELRQTEAPKASPRS